MALLDTTVLIDLARGPRWAAHQRAWNVTRQFLRSGQALFTSRISEAEFRVGPELSHNPANELSVVERVLSEIQILDFDTVAARHYAVVRPT